MNKRSVRLWVWIFIQGRPVNSESFFLRTKNAFFAIISVKSLPLEQEQSSPTSKVQSFYPPTPFPHQKDKTQNKITSSASEKHVFHNRQQRQQSNHLLFTISSCFLPMKDPFAMENSATIPITSRSFGSDALVTTLSNSIQALGRGFDVTSDIRLLYCKGAPGSRLVHLEEDNARDLVPSPDVVVPNVPVDIVCSVGKSAIERNSVCSFREVVS
jgi:hypothetical protein